MLAVKPPKRKRPVNPRYGLPYDEDIPSGSGAGVSEPPAVSMPVVPNGGAVSPPINLDPVAEQARGMVRPVNPYTPPGLLEAGLLKPAEQPPKQGGMAKGIGIAANALASIFAPQEQQPRAAVPYQYKPPPERPISFEDEFSRMLARKAAFRRRGGPVKPGTRYIVGEDGPEELILDQPGTVIANEDIRDPVVLEQLKQLAAQQQAGGGEQLMPINPASRPDDPVDPIFARANRIASLPPMTEPTPTPSIGSGRTPPIDETDEPPSSRPVNPASAAMQPNPAMPPDVNRFLQDEAMQSGANVPMPVNPMASREAVPGDNTVYPTAPPPKIYPPGKDPNKSRRENLVDQARERAGRDYSGKRDEQHPYRAKGRGIGNTLKAAGLGFLQAFAQTDPRMKLADRLIAAAGGGVAGAVGGTVDPNLAAKQWNQRKLAGIYGQIEQETKLEKDQADVDYRAAQTKGIGDRSMQADERLRQGDERLKLGTQRLAETAYDKGFRRAMAKLKLGYKKGVKPDLDAELARFGINIEQWDDNKRTFWQGQNLMTFDEDGEAVPVTNEKGETVTDITRAPVTLDYEGQKFTVPQTVAFQGLTNAGSRNTSIANADIDDENRRQQNLGSARADLTGVESEISGIQADIQGLQGQLVNLDPQNVPGDFDKQQSLQTQIRSNNRKLTELTGRQAELKKKVGELSKPLKKREKTTAPRVVPKDKDPMGLFR